MQFYLESDLLYKPMQPNRQQSKMELRFILNDSERKNQTNLSRLLNTSSVKWDKKSNTSSRQSNNNYSYSAMSAAFGLSSSGSSPLATPPPSQHNRLAEKKSNFEPNAQQSPKRKRDSKEERKKRLKLALDALNNGEFKNIHSAASNYDLNYNSLKNAYYKINGKDENSQRLSTSEREKRIKKAIEGFNSGKYSNLTEASKIERVCAETVRNRYHGRTQSFSEAKRGK